MYSYASTKHYLSTHYVLETETLIQYWYKHYSCFIDIDTDAHKRWVFAMVDTASKWWTWDSYPGLGTLAPELIVEQEKWDQTDKGETFRKTGIWPDRTNDNEVNREVKGKMENVYNQHQKEVEWGGSAEFMPDTNTKCAPGPWINHFSEQKVPQCREMYILALGKQMWSSLHDIALCQTHRNTHKHIQRSTMGHLTH